METKLKTLESKICYREHLEHIHYRGKLGKLYQLKANDAISRSKDDLYKHGEKPSKFFLVLKKSKLLKIRLEPFHAIKKKTIN